MFRTSICPKHVELFMIKNHNCCIKLVLLVIFIYDARSHIHEILILAVRFMLIKSKVLSGCLIATYLSLLMEAKGNVIFKLRNCGRSRKVHVFSAHLWEGTQYVTAHDLFLFRLQRNQKHMPDFSWEPVSVDTSRCQSDFSRPSHKKAGSVTWIWITNRKLLLKIIQHCYIELLLLHTIFITV